MKIVVTGANGFVGSHLLAKLSALGQEVVALDSVPGEVLPQLRWVVGDLGERTVREDALAGGCDALVHLATVPGGAAEENPEASRRINVDAMYDLMLESGALRPGVRFVYASSIAVFGDPLPDHVDDATPLSPRMIYGGHKAMMEHAVAMFSNRGLIDGVTVRLPGILARPQGPSGLKSAFMSNLFHAMRQSELFTCPVSPRGMIWSQSVDRCAENFINALHLDSALLPVGRAVTLPALRISMGDLVHEVARQCSVSPDLVAYDPDPLLEAAFGAQPQLETLAARRAGFTDDGNTAMLVRSALNTIK